VLVLHGDDAPVPGWRERLAERYGLGGSLHRFLFDLHRFLFDEHDRMLPGDPERVEGALGFRHG
jgi:hypothetical protein